MIEALVEDLTKICPNLDELRLGWIFGKQTAPGIEELELKLGAVISICHTLGWKDLANQGLRLLDKSKSADSSLEQLKALGADLREAINEKVGSVVVAVIEEPDTALFKDATRHLCGTSLHRDLAVSEGEFNLAGRALAFGLSTAAVYHSMRSVEASLHVLAKKLGITFTAPVELQDWANLTGKIKTEIPILEKQPRSKYRSEELKCLSALLLPADCFRLVWRNHVAHARESYEYEEARKALTYVGDYLRDLSATI